jgi:hypothetical protein
MMDVYKDLQLPLTVTWGHHPRDQEDQITLHEHNFFSFASIYKTMLGSQPQALLFDLICDTTFTTL